tara:strand:- start:2409 stop:3380 length:972 start_codon:yes stop_codon:yes gene_type:complete
MVPDSQSPSHESSASRRARFRDHFFHQVQWSDLDQKSIAQLIDLAAEEDLGGRGFATLAEQPGDPTSELFLSGRQPATAILSSRQTAVISGLRMAPAILQRFDPSLSIQLLAQDGDLVEPGSQLAKISGSARSLFTAERTLLNFIQFLSGVSTETHRLASLLQDTETRLLDTRKTHPGYRALLKYAVSQGGGWNHRLGLYDRIMIKDNHLAANSGAVGSAFREAVEKARSSRPDLPIEVEIDSLEQLPGVLSASPEIILFDNFSIDDMKTALREVAGKVLTEASGNITARTIPDLAGLGLDFISTGATIHQSRWIDLGLDVES